MSVRLRLTLSYVAFLMVASVLLLAVVWVFLLRYVPEQTVTLPLDGVPGGVLRPRPGTSGPDRSDLWQAFAPRAAQALGFLLLLGLGGGWLLAGRVLAPLRRITEVTRATGGGSLSSRVRLPGRSDEFRELADAVDGMLARLEAQVAEQQRFAANASHELRTPLAITAALLDVAREDPVRDPAALVERLSAVNARAVDLTEALLLLSRAEQRSAPWGPVDLSLLVEEATESLLPLAEGRGVSLTTGGGLAGTTGQPALLQQLTTNLVHNAVVHHLPAQGWVEVTTAVRPGAVLLTVENTGATLAPAAVATLVEPFQRGAERARSHAAGVGLGLAIVASITRAHDGRLTLLARPAGGLRVTVELPARTACVS